MVFLLTIFVINTEGFFVVAQLKKKGQLKQKNFNKFVFIYILQLFFLVLAFFSSKVFLEVLLTSFFIGLLSASQNIFFAIVFLILAFPFIAILILTIYSCFVIIRFLRSQKKLNVFGVIQEK